MVPLGLSNSVTSLLLVKSPTIGKLHVSVSTNWSCPVKRKCCGLAAPAEAASASAVAAAAIRMSLRMMISSCV
jgi:hypothetical protein